MTATTSLQEQLRAAHGQFQNGTYVVGVNLQIVPDLTRQCPICKTNRMQLWEETGAPNPKPRWWTCTRTKHTDACIYACRADDFPTISGFKEIDGAYDLSPMEAERTNCLAVCPACLRMHHYFYDEQSGTWGECECGFAYHAGLYSPRGHMMKALMEKRRNFLAAVAWYGRLMGGVSC